MLSLVAQLSELCESDHSPDRRTVPQDFGLRPFKSGEITKRNVCEDLIRILQAPLNPSEKEEHGMGYVYVLRSQIGKITIGELKIGFSKHHPEHRAHELARCLARPEIVSHTPLLPHAKRLESIIHTELQACRKVQSCQRCDQNHQEWFTVSHAESREVVTGWSKWILQRPYVDGQLTDKWKGYLAAKSFISIDDNTSLPDFWRTIINDFPRDELQGTESKRIGKYLNDCYWDVTCTQFGIDQFGKEFCDGLRDGMPRGRNSRGTSIHDMMGGLSATADMLRAFQEKDEDSNGQKWKWNDNCDSRRDIRFEDMLRPQGSRKTAVHPDMPISRLVRADTPLGRMYHPETRIRHLLNSDKSPGIRLRLIQRAEEDTKTSTKDLLNLLDSLGDLKTGVLSVSDPILGVTESPLGDATMLPVLALKDLKYMNTPVANWVGMNPTNSGFQLLQEAYREGKWFGGKPQFKLPKVYRKAGYSSLSAAAAKKGPSSKRRVGKDAGNDHPNSKRPKSDIPSFQLTCGPGFNKFTWTTPITDELIQQVGEVLAECRIGGREKVERSLATSLRHFGFDLGISDEGETSDSDSIPSSSSSTSEEEESDAEQAPLPSASTSAVPAKRAAASSPTRMGISTKKAKLWLESL